MTCRELEERLSDHLDGRLDAALELRLHAHAEACADCRARLRRWSRLEPALRAIEPPPPSPMRLRRMEAELERPPASAARALARRWPRRPLWAAGLTLAAAAAALLLLVRRPAAWTVVAGHARVAGELIENADDGELALTIGHAATVTLRRHARLALTVRGPAVQLRLDRGELTAQVRHRQPGETFVVATSDGRVEVRGTQLTVGYRDDGASWVAVREGRVAVFGRAGDAERSVGSGEAAWLAGGLPVAAPSGGAPSVAPPVGASPSATPSAGAPSSAAPSGGAPSVAPSAGAPSVALSAGAPSVAAAAGAPSVAAAAAGAPSASAPPAKSSAPLALRPPSGAAAARRYVALVRAAVRQRRYERALALLDRARRDGAEDDELRYLRAETLSVAHHLAEAVAAYRLLDRPGAPAETRQNALLAAAELERRRGRLAAARADYERALAVAPRAPLRAEALLGLAEVAARQGDQAAARAAAARYLTAAPAGPGAHEARDIVGGRAPTP